MNDNEKQEKIRDLLDSFDDPRIKISVDDIEFK